MTDPAHVNGSSGRGHERAESDSAGDDALLEAVVCGDRGRSDGDVERAARQSSAIRAKLAAFQNVEQALVSAARAQSADIAYAATLGGSAIDAGEDRLRERIAIALAPRRAVPWRSVAAAALLLIAVGGAFVASQRGDEPASTGDPPVYLGGDLACEEPLAACQEYSVFRWKGVLAAGATFEITIRDVEGREVDRFPGLRDNELRVPAERATRFPDRIEWQISMRDAGGVSATAVAEAWRAR